MTTQHTTGPWFVREKLHPYKDGSKFHIERGIYTQYVHPQLKDHFPVVCLSIGIGMDGEKAVSFIHIEEANARLIAAAPDLLEALKRVMPFIDCIAAVTREEIIEYEAAMKMADAAIKKATGQE
jgi:hypothetical protein